MPPTSIGDKAEHLIAYAVLGALGAASATRGVASVLVGLAAFGILIEVLQTFSPGRSPDPLDVAADVVGISLGCGAAIVLRHMRPLSIGNDADTAATASSSPDKRASCAPD